jgi:opacity protein-like surface antigen
MRLITALLVGVFATIGAVAHAQSPAAPNNGYVEIVAQSAFGNVTSQSFGAEVGVTVASRVQVFGEAGQVRDTAPSQLGSGAQLIAGFLSRTQNGVAFTVKQPVTFGVAGVRYGIPSGSVEPYVLAGFGMARVRRDAHFFVGGNEVTSGLEQFNVVLGTDLSGSETKAMLTLGGGIAWPAWRRLVVDFQFRYGRILTEGEGTNVSRAGIGLGVRF